MSKPVLDLEASSAVVRVLAEISDARAAHHAISLEGHRREDIEPWARALRWMHNDLLRVDDDAHAITTFSKQLIESYEQMSLLYRVGELMNDLNDPKGFVNMSCELLLTTLEFQWVAVRFSSLTSLGRALTNELIFTGQIPCSHTRYDRLAGELVSQRDAEDRPEVLEEATNELARIVGSEVFVNPLLCDNRLAGVVIAGSKGGPDPQVSSNDMQLISATADLPQRLHPQRLDVQRAADHLPRHHQGAQCVDRCQGPVHPRSLRTCRAPRVEARPRHRA